MVKLPSAVETNFETERQRIMGSLFFIRWLLFILVMTPAIAFSSNILILGDSLSAGYGIAPEQSWPSLLQQKLDHDNQIEEEWQVVNASVSGETTAGVQARLPDLLQQHQPKVCVIAIGANDGLRGMPVQQIESRLRWLVEQCEKTAKTLLIEIQLPPNYGPSYTQAFKRIYSTVAASHAIPLTPFLLDGFGADMSYFQADGLHPTASAQTKILANIWPTLHQILTNTDL